MDNLSRDSTAALKAGMSYGMWKALHPHTAPKPPDVTQKHEKLCQRCGNPLPKSSQPSRKFCSDVCKAAAGRERVRNKYRDKVGLTQGENRSRKLTMQDVMEARNERAKGATFPEIAKRFGVGASTIRRAVIGESWQDVPMGRNEDG